MDNRELFTAEQPAGPNPRQILILRPGAIGDTLLTFPAFRALRERFPGARLSVVGNRPALELARGAGLIHEADAFGADWVADLFGDEPTAALRTRLERYDLAIVWLHTDEAAGDLARMLRASGVGAALPALSFPAPGSRRHLADHLVDSLAPLGVTGAGCLTPSASADTPLQRRDGEGMGVRISTGIAPGLVRRGEGPGPLVIFHPGAGARYKRWPAERYAEIARRYAAEGWDVAVTAGPADEEAVDAFLRTARDIGPRVLQGLRLETLAATLAGASLVIGNDSGVTHLAALTGAPTLALFGPYDPAYWRPIGPRVTILDAGTDCPHRANPREGCRTCDKLSQLGVETVWKAAREWQ